MKISEIEDKRERLDAYRATGNWDEALLNDGNEEIWLEALEMTGKWELTLNIPYNDIRLNAYRATGRWDLAFNDKNEDNRLEAYRATGRWDLAFNDENADNRLEAYKATGRWDLALKDSWWVHRLEAYRATGRWDLALKDKDEDIRLEAQRMIELKNKLTKGENNMKYFKFSEFERSATAKRLGIDNSIPDNRTATNIELLVNNFLDPIREHIGEPIIITSGYRSLELNKAVGGSPTSYHQYGLAADFRAVTIPINVLFNKIITMRDKQLLPDWAELINEHGQWIHLATKTNLSDNARRTWSK